jgi:hypothetical protein
LLIQNIPDSACPGPGNACREGPDIKIPQNVFKSGYMVLVRVSIDDTIKGTYLFGEKEWADHRSAHIEIISIKAAAVYDEPFTTGCFNQHRVAEAHIEEIHAQVLICETVITGNSCGKKGSGYDNHKKGGPDYFRFKVKEGNGSDQVNGRFVKVWPDNGVDVAPVHTIKNVDRKSYYNA